MPSLDLFYLVQRHKKLCTALINAPIEIPDFWYHWSSEALQRDKDYTKEDSESLLQSKEGVLLLKMFKKQWFFYYSFLEEIVEDFLYQKKDCNQWTIGKANGLVVGLYNHAEMNVWVDCIWDRCTKSIPYSDFLLGVKIAETNYNFIFAAIFKIAEMQIRKNYWE